MADAEKNAATVEREIAEKSSRVEILRQLNEEGEGLGQGSQAVLRGLDDPERIRPELGGALLANLVSVVLLVAETVTYRRGQ